MNPYIVYLFLIFLLSFCDAKEFDCMVEKVSDSVVYVELKNTSDKDIVIMGGQSDTLVIFGILYLSNSNHTPKLSTIGTTLGMFETPDLILLPANYSRRIKVIVADLSSESQIIHMKLFFNYLSYEEFNKAMRESGGVPKNVPWLRFEKDIIRKTEIISKMNMKYGFGHGLSGN